MKFFGSFLQSSSSKCRQLILTKEEKKRDIDIVSFNKYIRIGL
jgi:hypothetical protein